ncbi:hypothetical protein CENDO_09745 [Corynebacterium endometrii]|uniref:Uncharacterized protein n=1 Tax=Corynebacterium endometrii TaxID=2488819 RepID=A0A4P7QHR3_9CORY|nr:hypothetical protein CENDO_09745 [Corynebacterium endometrii]
MRRRVAALIGVLVVVALIIWLLTSLGGGSSEEQTSQAAETATSAPGTDEPASGKGEAKAPAPAPTTSESAAPTQESAAESTTESEAPEESSEAPKSTCELQDLDITVSSDRPSYGQGQLPTFYATVDNPTGADCDINLDEDQLRFEVYRLEDYSPVWADVNCYPPVESGREIFPKGDERAFEAVWSRLESTPEQCNGRQPAAADSYLVYAAIGDKVSNAHTFNLREDA